MDNLVPIGRFSKICRLSVPTLRYYDELGLLVPAHVDPDSSYRYYHLSQVGDAETIRLLRALDLPLEEIQSYLREQGADSQRDLLNRHQQRMQERVEEGMRILSYLRRLQGGDDEAALPVVRARRFEPQEIISICACVPEVEVSGVRRAVAAELHDFLVGAGARADGPISTIFPDQVHNDDAVHMTVYVPVVQRLETHGRVVADQVDGGLAATIMHYGPNTLLDRSYGQLVSWMQRHGHEMAGPPREIYWRGPTETNDPNSYETEIIWPVA